MPKPLAGTYPAHFENYINLVNEADIHEALSAQHDLAFSFFDNISDAKSMHAYAPGKWTVKEMLQHIIDTERIFAYRSLAIARKETTSLPGFDENYYAENSNATARGWQSLVTEFKAVRTTLELLFESFTAEMLDQSGLANNKAITVNAIGFALVGHFYHHTNILETRYFVD